MKRIVVNRKWAFLLVALVAVASWAAVPALLAPSWPGVFEIEGDAVNDPAVTGEDWNDLNVNPIGIGTSGFVTGSPGSSEVWTFVSDPPLRTDFIYTGGGSKDFNDVTDWGSVARGTGPDKDDVEHAFAAKYINPADNHVLLFFGGDRPTSHGDANIGFWFFQNPVAPNNSGGFTGTHANGDIFVLSSFSGGGGTTAVRVLVWVGTPDTAGPGGTDSGSIARCATFSNPPGTACGVVGGACIDPKSDTTEFPDGTLCDITLTATDAGSGKTNEIIGDIAVAWQYQNKDNKTTCTTPPCTIPPPDFFEGVIDLTNLGLADECLASFLLETRSSADVSAVLKDFALGAFNTCSCSAGDASVCTGGTTQICAENPAGTSPPYHYAWTGPNGPIATDAQCITISGATPADAGDYTVTITASGGITTTCSATLTVGTGPTATVSGGGEYCADTGGSATITLTLTGTAPWTVTWSDIGQQTYNTSPVTRTVSPTVTTTFTVSAVSDGNALGCVGSTSGSATVVVDPNPVVAITTVPCSDATQIQLTASCSGAVCTGFSWTATNGGHIVSGALTSTILVDRAGTYTVTGSVAHSNAPTCTGTASRNVGLCAEGP